jgi:hypothetical protein
MPQPFDKASQTVLRQAQAAAEATGTVESVHVLYALLVAAPQVWEKLPHVNAGAIKAALPQFNVPPASSAATKVVLANNVKRVLAFSMEECLRGGKAPFSSAVEFVSAQEWVAPEYILLGLLRESDCEAAQFLQSHGIRLEDARRTFSRQA